MESALLLAEMQQVYFTKFIDPITIISGENLVEDNL